MIQYYDLFNQAEKPAITLCQPNKTEIAMLHPLCYDTKLTKRYNATSELEFKFPSKVDGVNITAYDLVVGKRLVYVNNIDYFIIVEANEDIENDIPVKTVKCRSLDFELSYKKLFILSGTYYFYNPLDTGRSIMHKIISYCPTWSIGTIDPTLQLRARTFDISDTTVYTFLMSTASTSYGCVFTFDTINKTISAKKIENIVLDSDIFISQDNLVKKIELKEISDEIVTRLYVYGGNDLDIRTVNPLGENCIYNFDYFKNTKWMTQGLINAINAWEALIEQKKPSYATKLTELKNLYAELTDLQTQYNEVVYGKVVNGKRVDGLRQYEAALSLAIKSGTPAPTSQKYRDLLSKISELQIEAQELKDGGSTGIKPNIEDTKKKIDTKKAELISINRAVSFERNFTVDQYNTLTTFFYENTWQNEYILALDSDTPEKIQELSETLYEQAEEVLARVSQPRYEFSMDLVNFIFLKEYEKFTQQLQMGSKVYIQGDSYSFYVVLLEIQLNYDKPDDFELVFGNRLRLDDAAFIYSDLFGNIVKTGSSVSFDSAGWSDWIQNYKTEVSTFVSSALNATNNELKNSDNEDILIDQSGLRARKFNDVTKTFDDKQVWLTSNLLAFTSDNWNTITTALGEVTLPTGGKQFGLFGGAVYGTLLAGESLRITNVDPANPNITKKFTVDVNGVTIENADLKVKNVNTEITIDPDKGIKIVNIKKSPNETVFFVDTDGSLIFRGSGRFSGSVTATAGFLGGWTIDKKGIKDADLNNYIYKDIVQLASGNFKIEKDGTVKLGKNLGLSTFYPTGKIQIGSHLTIEPNGDARFTGNIYAANLDDYDPNTKGSGVPPQKINPNMGFGGYGGIGWGGGAGSMSVSGTGVTQIKGSTAIEISTGAGYGGGVLGIDANNAYVYGNNAVAIQGGALDVSGITSIVTGSGDGQTTDVTISGTTLSFKNGILYSVV